MRDIYVQIQQVDSLEPNGTSLQLRLAVQACPTQPNGELPESTQQVVASLPAQSGQWKQAALDAISSYFLTTYGDNVVRVLFSDLIAFKP